MKLKIFHIYKKTSHIKERFSFHISGGLGGWGMLSQATLSVATKAKTNTP